MEAKNDKTGRKFWNLINSQSIYAEGEEIKKEEIKGVIQKMKRKKASGEDGIPNEAWIHGEEDILEDLEEILNKIWKEEHNVPEKWKCEIVIPVFKKGDKNVAQN